MRGRSYACAKVATRIDESPLLVFSKLAGTCMKVVITGVAGFIGSTIADKLVDAPEVSEVIGIDCFSDYYGRELKERNLRRLRDFRKFRLLETDLLGLDWAPILDGVSSVYHQAAQAGVRSSWGKDFSIYTNTNILATQGLLESCRGRQVRVVCASSSSVYGETTKLPMHENDRPRPVSPYGVSKLASEHLGVLYHRNFQLAVMNLRYFTVYGPRQRPDMAFTRFIKAGLKGEAIELYGDGEQTRDFTFVDDAVMANILAMRQGHGGEVYNIGGGSRVSVNQVIQTLEEILNRNIRVINHERAKGDVTHTYADTTKAREELDFRPTVRLREGLARQVDWVINEVLPNEG